MNDRRCLAFSKGFYAHVMENPGCYGAAFVMACAHVDAELAAGRLPSQASGAARPCLLWDDSKALAVDGAWVLKQRRASGRSVWQDFGLRELADDEEEEGGTSGAASQESSSMKSRDGEDGKGDASSDIGSGEGDDGGGGGREEEAEEDDDDGVTRMANNPKGQAELEGFKSLNFNLDPAEKGSRLYRARRLDGTTVQQYGLEEDLQFPLYEGNRLVRGKFLLKYKTQAKP